MGGQMPQVYEGNCPYIFVSYAHAGRDAVLSIIRVLVDEGYRVWYDDGIELGIKFTKEIADHVYGCTSFIMFVSKASLKSRWCNDEVNYALELGKAIVPVYLEEVELPRDLHMRLVSVQALYRCRYSTDDELYAKLFETPAINCCLTEGGEKRRRSKNLLVQRAKKVLDAGDYGREDLEAMLENLRTLSRSLPRRDEDVERLAHGFEERITDERKKEERRTKEEQPATLASHTPEEGDAGVARQRKENIELRSSSVASKAVVVIVVVCIIAVIAYGVSQMTSVIWQGVPQKTSDSLSVNDTEVAIPDEGSTQHDASVDDVMPKLALNDYSWDELKKLATAIAKASDGAWLNIAKHYNLVDNDGKLQGNEKVFTLDNDNRTKVSVRILGFRHDGLWGGGSAGITFEFTGAPVKHSMNQSSDNTGGWEKSEIREWLNSDFLDLLPPDLRRCIQTVGKRTNNAGLVGSEDDASVVTTTYDGLWLLSLSEVYGHVDSAGSSATYDAEGVQYKLYADKGTTVENHTFCKKREAGSWWWLRSPIALSSNGFLFVDLDGGWRFGYAYYECGVSPSFCF